MSDSLPTAWDDLLRDAAAGGIVAPLPGALLDFLADLRLLRGVPLRYLVPDGGWLPIESIRFFHIDPDWTDRLIDGVFAAGSVGSQDQVFSARVLQSVRDQVDTRLYQRLMEARGVAPGYSLVGAVEGWAKVHLSGFILRSELVQRWPGLSVRAYYNQPRKDPPPPERHIATLRLERLGAFLLIAIFAGVPDRVEIEEPQAGVRMRLSRQDKPVQRAGALDGVQDIYAGATSTSPVQGPGAFAASLVDPPFVAIFEGASSQEIMGILRAQVSMLDTVKMPVGGDS